MATIFGMDARGLGVGESTLRRWEGRGLIPTGELPRTGVLRFRPEDVEALEVQVFRDFPAIVEEELPLVSVGTVDG